MKSCPSCQAHNLDSDTVCAGCGRSLVVAGEAAQRSCPACGAANPFAANFCAKCGERLSPASATEIPLSLRANVARERGKARLSLAPGKPEERSVLLNEQEHSVGSRECFVSIADDDSISQLHAILFYENGKLFIEDQASANGVYIRIKAPMEIKDGTWFRCGSQVFACALLASVPGSSALLNNDGTRFIGSPASSGLGLSLRELLSNGREGGVWFPRKEMFNIGRQGCDLNFPDDAALSTRHTRITKSGSKYFLSDSGSQSGTFIKLNTQHELAHGDCLLIGRTVLRVAIDN